MTARQPLAPRQADCLEAIRAYAKREGHPPTRRELCVEMGISPKSGQGVRDHLDALQRKGWIELGKGKSRAITVLDEQPRFITVNIYKSIGWAS